MRAFRSAAQAIENLPEPCVEMLRKGTLTDVPRLGKGIARRVAELAETGRLAELEELRASGPRGLAEIMRVEGMGPRSAVAVWRALGVSTVDELEAAALEGRLRGLPRFGARKEEKVLAAIAAYRRARGRWKLTVALPHAEALVERLRALPRVLRVEMRGTLRRRRDTVGDIDLLAAARPRDAPGIAEAFATFPSVREVIARGATKTSVRLRDGIQVDLRIVGPLGQSVWIDNLHREMPTRT